MWSDTQSQEDVRTITIQWSPPQGRSMLSMTRYLDLEGAIRSGKTTVLIWKAITLLQNNPGMLGMLTRWTQDSLDTQLKPQFWQICPKELLEREPWHGKEEYVQFANGSKLFLRALKSGDEGARYVKTAGLEFAFIGLDQPEEVPRDVYEYLKGRLSQKGYPHQFVVTPNPPDPNHWLCEEFPTDNSRPGYEYIHFTIWDNKHNLHPDYIAALEKDYPQNHPMRKRLLYGLRGAQAAGTPVYGKVFKRAIHVPAELVPDASSPIFESWDFGFNNPAVSWSQWTKWGTFQILGELQGRQEYLENFIPKVIAKRKAIVTKGQDVWVTCDPSGANPTSHGTNRTAVQLLNDAGIYPTINPKANRAEQKIWAIQHLARLMLRLTPEGPALAVHPDCATIIDGFATGYAYPQKLLRGLLIPAKDGFYDHLQNTLEYTALAFLIPEHPDVIPVRDEDEDDVNDRVIRRRTASSRSGY
jgi:hypothetical protein